MIHSKMCKPRAFPWNSARVPEQIDRLQNITGDQTLNREKVYEIGRVGRLGFKKGTPTFAYSATQFEYGSMAFWYDLANKATPVAVVGVAWARTLTVVTITSTGHGLLTGDLITITVSSDVTALPLATYTITKLTADTFTVVGLNAGGATGTCTYSVRYYIDLDNLVETQCDIAAFLTDDNATFRGTIWFPGLRVNGFSINIADPAATIERSFDLVGEDYKMLDAKYLAYQSHVATIPIEVITLSPAAIEWASGDFVFRVLRVRSGVVSELEEGVGTNQWSYATGDVTVNDCVATDLIKIYYPAATAYTTTWTDNDADPDLLLAEYAEISLKVGTGTRIYRLQSVGIDVAFDRADYKEIGNSEVVQRGVNNKTVTVALNRFAENFALEDILASDTIYPYIDPSNFAEDIQMQVKIFGEKAHTNFKIGFLVTGLSPTTIGTTQDVEAYQQRTVNLESDNLMISDHETEIAFV